MLRWNGTTSVQLAVRLPLRCREGTALLLNAAEKKNTAALRRGAARANYCCAVLSGLCLRGLVRGHEGGRLRCGDLGEFDARSLKGRGGEAVVVVVMLRLLVVRAVLRVVGGGVPASLYGAWWRVATRGAPRWAV